MTLEQIATDFGVHPMTLSTWMCQVGCSLKYFVVKDITEHRTAEGKLHLCAVKDVLSNRIAGYSVSDRMKAALAVTALNNAVARRGMVPGCVVHSDRVSQLRSRRFVHNLNWHNMIGSAGRVGPLAITPRWSRSFPAAK